jgi:23S rRNA (cytosine1962-C5)-methyltransferase
MRPSLNKSLSLIPSPDPKRIALRVNRRAVRALRGGHPWLFESAITHQNREGKPGDLAVVFDKDRKFLAVGLYDPTSHIRVRILAHRKPVQIDRHHFESQLQAALQIRAVLSSNTTGYRLVHGGNDNFPGLVIDRYGETLVLKLYSPAWLPHLRNVLMGLAEIIPFDQAVLRLSRAIQKQPQYLYGIRDGVSLLGDQLNTPIRFQENGLWFEADPLLGHKTGFYLDQRENRARVSALAEGKSVLNVFAYTGGFSVYAAYGNAVQVTSLDISRPALEAAQRNFAHNQHFPAIRSCEHEILPGDAFEILTTLHSTGRRFDLIVIDPPSFAKIQPEIQGAIKAYQQLTRLGLNVLSPGGVLVQASCSSRVSQDDFFPAVHRAAQEAGRPLQEFERTAHPLDHPIGFKEGAYLKCLFATT